MTVEDYFMERFHNERLTKREIVGEIKAMKLKTSFGKLLQNGYIRATGHSYQNEEFYAPNVPSWMKIGYPISRLEAARYGANYKMPLRIEKWLVDYLKNQLLWSHNDVLLWWNSSSARHFTDGFEHSWHEFKSKSSFWSYISKKDKNKSLTDDLMRSMKALKIEDPVYVKQNAEDYYKSIGLLKILSEIGSIVRRDMIIKDPATLTFYAKHKKDFLLAILEKKELWYLT